jgi:DNA-directed RNA polymerase omega subunit
MYKKNVFNKYELVIFSSKRAKEISKKHLLGIKDNYYKREILISLKEIYKNETKVEKFNL